jgi:acylphosphatase
MEPKREIFEFLDRHSIGVTKQMHYNITVKGVVQGVSFRQAARSEAMRLGVAGTVRNAKDGSVRIEAEGEEVAVRELVRWCGQGPALAQVSGVVVAEGEWQGLRGFNVL